MNDELKSRWSVPFARLTRVVPWAVALGGAILTLQWATQWMSGRPDDYPGEIMRGLVVSLFLTLSSSSELVRSSSVRRTLRVLSMVMAILAIFIVFSDMRMTPGRIAALVVIAGGVVKMGHALRPEPGLTMAEWKAMPVTYEGRRGVCTGVVIMLLGFALFMASLTGFARDEWPLNLVSIISTLIFVVPAVFFLRLRDRLPR
jgi:hypothetical protein